MMVYCIWDSVHVVQWHDGVLYLTHACTVFTVNKLFTTRIFTAADKTFGCKGTRQYKILTVVIMLVYEVSFI